MKELHRFRQFLTEGVIEDEIASRIRKLGAENGITNADIEKYVGELSGFFEPDAYKNTTDADYYEIYLTNDQGLKDAIEYGEGWEPEYLEDVDPGMYQMVYWNDEGPDSVSFNSKLEFVIGAIMNFWGEDQFIDDFGIQDEIDAAGDDWGKVFDKHVEDNLDMYYDKVLNMSDTAYPDSDSGSGVVIIEKGKIVAGKKLASMSLG